MDIQICFKSRVIAEALHALITKQANGHRVFIANGEENKAGCCPDLLLVDNSHVNDDLLNRPPGTKVLMIDTGLEQEEVIHLLLSYKLDGVLSTDADESLLRKALTLVHEGQIWIDNSKLKALLSKAGTISKNGTLNNVSKREQQIVNLIQKGYKNKEIAQDLFLSEQTIKAHVSRIFKKFNVSSRSQLMALIMKSHEQSVQHSAS